MKKKYILWDHDGVLVNTEEWYFKANKKALSEIEIDINESEYMHYMQNGISIWSIPRKKGVSEELLKKQRNKRNEYYRNYLVTQNIEIPNVIAVLRELKEQFAMAIVTTSRTEDFDLIHERRTILYYMDFHLTLEDYKRSKPFPDPYLKGMSKFNAQPHECIIIEDSSRGLKSAIAAGIECIIIKHEFTKSHDFTGANYIVENIQKVPEILFDH